jgi:hypothetical protein
MCIETQDKDGNWIPATPEPLTCEIDGCPKTNNGDWYFRNTENKDGSDWDTEPIYLCKEHGKNHELFKEE